jgi:hypothetical protein
MAAMILLLAFGAPGAAQPCNPVIDGTYCATNSGPRLGGSTSSTRIPPISSIADDISFGQDETATLGAITFRGGGKRCIGLLRRGSCN